MRFYYYTFHKVASSLKKELYRESVAFFKENTKEGLQSCVEKWNKIWNDGKVVWFSEDTIPSHLLNEFWMEKQ